MRLHLAIKSLQVSTTSKHKIWDERKKCSVIREQTRLFICVCEQLKANVWK